MKVLLLIFFTIFGTNISEFKSYSEGFFEDSKNKSFISKNRLSTNVDTQINSKIYRDLNFELIGIAVTLFGILIASGISLYQIIYYLKEKEKQRISLVKSSVLNVKSELADIQNEIIFYSQKYNSIRMKLNSIFLEKVEFYWPDIEPGDDRLDEFKLFWQEPKNLMIVNISVLAELSNLRSEITQVSPDFDKVKSLVKNYEYDMPLVSSLVYDIVKVTELLINSFLTPEPICSLIEPQNMVNFLEDLEINNINSEDYLEIIMAEMSQFLFYELMSFKHDFLTPMLKTSFVLYDILSEIILGLNDSQMIKLRRFDQNIPYPNNEILLRMAHNWDEFYNKLLKKITKKNMERELQKKYDRVCISLRHLIDTSQVYQSEEMYELLDRYPHLRGAIPRDSS